jgi:hypothetical protein
MTSVTLRKVPGGITLGLLASLMAHGVLYGSSHAMGGSYHELLVQIALLGFVGLFAFFGAVAWGDAGGTSDGSVLAARLRERVPNVAGVFVSAGVWFVAAESIEPGHTAAPIAASLATLIGASYAVSWFARVITRAIARAVLIVTRTVFAPRTPAWQHRFDQPIVLRRTLLSRRRFARPPPIATFNCA